MIASSLRWGAGFDLLVLAMIWSALAFASLIITARVADKASLREVVSGTLLVIMALPIALFALLGRIGLFRLDVIVIAIGATAVLSLLGRRHLSAETVRIWRHQLASALSAWKEAGALRLGSYVLGALIAVRAFRGLCIPPLAWDSLTYHYVKPALWIQEGGLSSFAIPGAWSYYRYFPQNCEVIWSYLMLPGHSDDFVALGGVISCSLVAAGMYALSRATGASQYASFGAAFLLSATPAIANTLTSGYVDTFALGCVLLGASFIPNAVRRKSNGASLFCLLGFALAAGTKLSYLPSFVMVLAVIMGAHFWRGRHAPVKAIGVALACALLPFVCMHDYITTWREMGSPLYPMPTKLQGLFEVPGNALLISDLTADMASPAERALTVGSLSLFWQAQFIPYALQYFKESFNFGPAAVIAFLAGFAALLLNLCRRSQERWIWLLLIALFLPQLALPVTEYGVGYRVRWLHFSARFMLAAYALLICASAVAFPRKGGALLTGMAIFQLPLLWPLGIGVSDMRSVLSAMLTLGPFAILAVVGLVVGVRIRSNQVRALVCASAIFAAVFGIGTACASAKSRYKFSVYEEAAQGTLYDSQFVYEPVFNSWPIWQALDAQPPSRIAMCSGYDRRGTNWLIYPLMGSRLQNRLMHISPYKDPNESGSMPSRQRQKAELDPDAWFARLIHSGADAAVALFPKPTEDSWMRANPKVFAPAADAVHGESSAYRIAQTPAQGKR